MAPRLPPQISRAVSNRGLKLIVNSSEQCNLRCVYCYETFAHGHMPMDLAKGLVHLVDRRVADGLDWLELEFFGGEPLGAWGVVKYIAGGVHQTCSQHGVAFLGGMTTNATLLHLDRLEWLVQHGINSFQITLDGPREIHDGRRAHMDKTGSFDVIWQRLAALRASDLATLNVMIRLHFDAASWPILVEKPGFLDAVIETFVRNDPRFKLRFNALQNWGPTVSEGIDFFANRRASQAALQELLARARDAGLDQSQVPQLRREPSSGEPGCNVCYAARANAYVIRADGAVSKCTVAFDDDRNVVGRLTGNGDLIIDHERHKPWLRGLVSGDAVALACPAKGHIW